MDGIFYCDDQSTLILENNIFENINSLGPGTLILALNNKEASIQMTNCIFKNSFSNTYFIDYEFGSTLILEKNRFFNCQGNMIFLIHSGLNISDSQFQNISCTYDSGCIIKAQKSSNVFLSQNTVKDITNSNEGGAFYIIKSNVSLSVNTFSNINSTAYASCMFGEESNVHSIDLHLQNFLHGCLYFVNSSVSIEDSNFQNDYESFVPKDGQCYSSICMYESTFFAILKTTFNGNRNNTHYGGVNKNIILNFFFSLGNFLI